MADAYEGPVRIYGQDGTFLTGGVAALETDPEMGSWKGVLQTLNGAAVAGKALVVELEIPADEARRGRAQLIPQGVVGDKATSMVTGLGEQPF